LPGLGIAASLQRRTADAMGSGTALAAATRTSALQERLLIPFDAFESRQVDVQGLCMAAKMAGRGTPMLLLHGFPQTHLMWRDVAPRLCERFTTVCFDLPGYGASAAPAPAPDHAPHSKRSMAAQLVAAMDALGFHRFIVVGHDRGARVGYRLALDHPERVLGLAVLDIVPTAEAWRGADAGFALAYWPWSLLAQAAPLPERVLTRCADEVVACAMDQWGSPPEVFSAPVRQAYADALRRPASAQAICEEYRAAASIDRTHDDEDLAAGRRIACATLALWGRGGYLDTACAAAGGPLAVWRRWCSGIVEGEAVEGGHFFPEEDPEGVAARLLRRFAAS
jgi:haloacetate dehalogenase